MPMNIPAITMPTKILSNNPMFSARTNIPRRVKSPNPASPQKHQNISSLSPLRLSIICQLFFLNLIVLWKCCFINIFLLSRLIPYLNLYRNPASFILSAKFIIPALFVNLIKIILYLDKQDNCLEVHQNPLLLIPSNFLLQYVRI